MSDGLEEIFFAALRQFVHAQHPGVRLNEIARDKQVRHLVRYAADTIPFYRDLYRENKIDIDAIATADDLWKLPAVNKSDFLRAGPRHYTDEYDSLLDAFVQKTSGSTGSPLSIFARPREAEVMLASFWSGWVSAGVNLKDRIFLAGSRQLGVEVPEFNVVFCPQGMSLDEQIERYRAFEPTIVIGLTEAVALLAKELERLQVDTSSVRMAFVLGQTYTEFLRRMVRSGFACEVFDLFGASECSWLGCECAQHHGCHIPETQTIVQISRVGQPNEPVIEGEAGEIIVTSLLRRTTPFVRYRLHDVAGLDSTPCPCGRTSPRLVRIEGRVHDFLVARNGEGVPATTIDFDVWLQRPGIVDYRVVQESRDRVRVFLIVDLTLGHVDADDVRATLRRRLGEVEVAVEFVSEIPRDPSGKRRRVYRTFDLPG